MGGFSSASDGGGLGQGVEGMRAADETGVPGIAAQTWELGEAVARAVDRRHSGWEVEVPFTDAISGATAHF